MTEATAPARPSFAAAGQSDLLRAVALAAVWVLGTLWLYWGKWGEDVAALYMAGHFWASGQTALIYAAPEAFFGGTAEVWEATMRSLGIADKVVYPFVYPPLWAVVMAPVSGWLSPQGFSNAANLVQVPMIAASVLMAGRLACPRDWSLVQWTLVSLMVVSGLLPGIGAVHFIQPTITTTFLTVLSVYFLRLERPVAAGTALALAAALKLSPALFVVVFLIDRQWRALAAFAIVGAVLALASLALAGTDMHHDFLAALDHATRPILFAPGNFSLRLVLVLGEALRTGHSDILLAIGPLVVTPATPVIDRIVGITSLVTLALLARALVPRPRAERQVLALVGVSLVAPLFGPIGWMHYYVLPLLFVIALPGLARSPALPVPIALLGLMLLKPVFDLFKTFVPGQTIYVLIVCALWLALLVPLLIRRTARPTSGG